MDSVNTLIQPSNYAYLMGHEDGWFVKPLPCPSLECLEQQHHSIRLPLQAKSVV